MKNSLDDFEYKIYDKFTELFVSQKGITESLKLFEVKIENLAISMSDFRIRVDEIQNGILKNENILLKVQILARTLAVVLSLSVGSIFMFKEAINGNFGSIIKFFTP